MYVTYIFFNLLDSLDLTLRIAASTDKRELPRSSILSSCHSKSFGNQEISWRDSRFQPQEPQTKPETETTKGPSTRERKKCSFLVISFHIFDKVLSKQITLKFVLFNFLVKLRLNIYTTISFIMISKGPK